MSKKILLLLILIILGISACIEQSTEPDLYETILKRDRIIVGTSFNSKPFSFKDSDEKIQGVEADLAREIAKRMLGEENKIIFEGITPQERIKAAMSDEVDMVISTMTINSKRKKLVKFSVPYFEAGQVICAKKESKIESTGDLINKKVITILGTTGEENIKKLVPNAYIWGFSDNADAIDAFRTTSADAITTDDSLLLGLTMDNNDYLLLPGKLTKEPYGIAFQKSGKTKKFEKRLNEIINDIINDGTLYMIKDKWGVH